MGTIGIREIRLLKLTPFLLSDGGISPKGKNSWRIYFRNNNPDLIKEFRKRLFELCGSKGALETRRDGSYMVKLNSKELGEHLLKLTNSYRTKKCKVYPTCPKLRGGRQSCKVCDKKMIFPLTQTPKKIFLSQNLAKYFLKVYISCDGGISVTVAKKSKYPFLVRKIFIEVKHQKLKDDLVRMLKLFQFNPKVYETQIRLTTKEDITKFNKIGFVKGCKIGKNSKLLRGYEKNYILKKVLESYKDPKKLIMFIQKKVAV